jgi:hypothetical protein
MWPTVNRSHDGVAGPISKEELYTLYTYLKDLLIHCLYAMCMFYRDYKKRMKERKDSGSWTMMRNKTQVEWNHIMWDLTSESEVKVNSLKWEVKTTVQVNLENFDWCKIFVMHIKNNTCYWFLTADGVAGYWNWLMCSSHRKVGKRQVFCCTTEPGLRTKPCQTRMENTAECVSDYRRVLLLMS